MKVNSKIPYTGTTIFSVMSALAHKHQAVNLSQGFPDFDISKELIQQVSEAMQMGYNQYAPMPGLIELRTALSEKIVKCNSVSINPETEITITPGATYAIYTALSTILHAGDEVIILEPAYDSYIPNIVLNGARPICVPLQAPNFSIDWNVVNQAVTSHTRAIIINTPHNPTGYSWTKDDIKELEKLVSLHDLYIISDEVYEHIVFDGRKHESILNYPSLYQRAFVIFSFGKVFHTTGWKMGYCVAPSTLTSEFRKIHQYLSFSCNTPMQYGLATYIKDSATYEMLPNFFQQKRELFLSIMKETPFTLFHKTSGSYFQLMGYEKISSLPDKEFAVWLTEKYGVATIPISAFNHDGSDNKLVRFCFAKQNTTLEEAALRLQKL